MLVRLAQIDQLSHDLPTEHAQIIYKAFQVSCHENLHVCVHNVHNRDNLDFASSIAHTYENFHDKSNLKSLVDRSEHADITYHTYPPNHLPNRQAG